MPDRSGIEVSAAMAGKTKATIEIKPAARWKYCFAMSRIVRPAFVAVLSYHNNQWAMIFLAKTEPRQPAQVITTFGAPLRYAPRPNARCILGARRDECKATRNPLRECLVGPVTLWRDPNEAGDRPPAHFHRLHMWLAKCMAACLRADANHQAPSPADGTAHGAIHHEAQPAHHLLLDDIAPSAQHLAHPLSGEFIVSH
jgi:hypothetical protein